MPREEEEVMALDESFNTRLERALAQEANGSLSLEPTRALSRTPLQVKKTNEDGYLSDDDKFQQLLDKKLQEEQVVLERQGIPAENGIPLIPIKKTQLPKESGPRSMNESRKYSREPRLASNKENISSTASPPPSLDGSTTEPTLPSSPGLSMVGAGGVSGSDVSIVADLPSTRPKSKPSRKTYNVESLATAADNSSAPAQAPPLPQAAPSSSAVPAASATTPSPTLDVNDKKLKTPRKAGGKKLAAGTPMAGAKSILGQLGATASLGNAMEQDPRLLRENNRRLAQELNRARLDMREMHDHHEKERQDLQDEIVRLRQLAGGKDDGVREMLEKRVERALTCHNGALEKVATLLGDDVPMKLHCRVSFILENVDKLKGVLDDLLRFLFGESQPNEGMCHDLVQIVECIQGHTREHDEMMRNFVSSLSDAQLNLQLALEDDVDFLSSSAMPSIMNPLNASTMHHEKTRLQQILTDKTEALQRNAGASKVPDQEEPQDEDVGVNSPLSHELSNVMEEDEGKRASSYLLARKRSSAVTRRTSVAPQPQSVDGEEVPRRSRNSRRESIRLSTGFPQAMCKSPRVSQLLTTEKGTPNTPNTPNNRTISVGDSSPSSVEGSPDVFERAVMASNLSLGESAVPTLELNDPIDHDLNTTARDATSTEANDMELTTSEPAPAIASDSLSVSLDGAAASGLSHPGTGPLRVHFASTSLRQNESEDSLIMAAEVVGDKRSSSFIRLYATPPTDEVVVDRSQAAMEAPMASPLLPPPQPTLEPTEVHQGPDQPKTQLEVGAAAGGDVEDEEPAAKKIKTTTTKTATPPARGARKSKMVAAQHLKDVSLDDSAVFVPPAPPKAKGERKKKNAAETKTGKQRSSSSSSSSTSSSGRGSQSAKIGDVDMDTYKKMVVGQKVKPARSKSRKLSKSEEKEIRAAADMKAKAKPQEYAAFDASSRFGEGLSFLDDTHVPTLHEFKQKQMNKPGIQIAPSAPSTSASVATAAPSPRKRPPPPAAAAFSPGVTEDFLSASKSPAARASSAKSPAPSRTASASSPATGGKSRTPGGKRGKGGGGRKKVDYRESVGDDDDFIVEKPKKKTTKKKENTKKKESVVDVTAVKVTIPSPEEDPQSLASNTASEAGGGRRRGRGPPKSYAEPPVNTKMRR